MRQQAINSGKKTADNRKIEIERSKTEKRIMKIVRKISKDTKLLLVEAKKGGTRPQIDKVREIFRQDLKSINAAANKIIKLI
jgi:hypothetical protein